MGPRAGSSAPGHGLLGRGHPLYPKLLPLGMGEPPPGRGTRLRAGCSQVPGYPDPQRSPCLLYQVSVLAGMRAGRAGTDTRSLEPEPGTELLPQGANPLIQPIPPPILPGDQGNSPSSVVLLPPAPLCLPPSMALRRGTSSPLGCFAQRKPVLGARD